MLRRDVSPRDGTAPAAVQTAHFEEIGEIAVEQHGEPQGCRDISMIADRKSLIGRTAQQEDRAHDVESVLGRPDGFRNRCRDWSDRWSAACYRRGRSPQR